LVADTKLPFPGLSAHLTSILSLSLSLSMYILFLFLNGYLETKVYVSTVELESNCGVEFNSLQVKLRGHAIALLVEALCYKPEGRGFDS
jgi:hypothetical protein